MGAERERMLDVASEIPNWWALWQMLTYALARPGQVVPVDTVRTFPIDAAEKVRQAIELGREKAGV